MKILIITFTKGINPGTFMQALGVKTAFQKAFPNATIHFLDFPDFKRNNGIQTFTKRSLSTLFLQKLYAAIRLIAYNKAYKRTFTLTPFQTDLFNYQPDIVNKLSEYDIISVGSDTILEEACINDNIGINWLPFPNLKAKKIFFAASASPANFSLTAQQKEILTSSISNLKYIGIRDNLTTNYLTNQLNINVASINKQPDPTFYLDVNTFTLPKRYAKRLTGKKIALYNFNINFPYRKELAHLLKKKGYTLVSTFYNPYVDIQVATVDAFGWAGLFKHCHLIVTERFHDSVFGLRNCKPVIAIDWEKKRFANKGDSKTFRILEDYNLTDLHFNLSQSSNLQPIEEAIDKLDTIFDAQKINQINLKYIQRADTLLEKIKGSILK